MDPIRASLAAADATGPRFALITNDNVSGYLWITTLLCLVYSFLVISIRWHIKWNLYGWDDYTATVATFLQLAGAVPMFIALNNGLGKSEKLQRPSWVAYAGKMTWASQIFILASLCAAKCSIAYLLLRLFTRDLDVTRKPWLLCNGTLALTIAWGIGSMIGVGVGCQPSAFLRDVHGHYERRLLRWRIIIGFDIAIELLLILLPVFFLWRIQMKRYIKLQVIIAFGVRFPVIALAAAHLHHLAKFTNDTGDNPSKQIIPALVYIQLELFWALIAATIPTMKTFMKSFNSGFGMEIDLDGYGTVSRRHDTGYQLQTFSTPSRRYSTVTTKISTKLRHMSETIETVDDDCIRTNTVGTETPIYHAQNTVSIDAGSQEMIITREVDWTVSYEGPHPRK